MKKIVFLFLFIGSLFQSNAQSSSYEKGFRDGYCQAKKEDKGQYTPCGVTPLAPIPDVNKDTYQYGFSAGQKKYNGGNDSKSETQKMLIQGAKDAAPKFVDYGKAFSDGYNSTSTTSKIQKGPSSIVIQKDIEIDLNDFTHIAIVEAPLRKKFGYNRIEKVLESSQFEIINPANKKKNKEYSKRFKKNPIFLRNEKNTSWLYLTITASRNTIESLSYITYFITLRNSNNEMLYKAKAINLQYGEQLDFLINF